METNMDATDQGAIIERLGNILEPKIEETQEETQEEVPEQLEETETNEESEVEEESESEEQDEQDDANEIVEETLELSQFASILGIDEDRLDIDEDGQVFVKTKVDGEEGRAKFQDLIKSYQLEGHLNRKNMEAAEKSKAFESMKSEFETQKQQQINQLENLSQVLYQDLTADYNAVNWNELRAVDPGEYAAKMAEFQQREQRIMQTVNQIEEQKAQGRQAIQQKLNEHLANEDQKLRLAMDGWSDDAKAQKELGEIYSYLGEIYGFSNQDLRGVYDNAGNIQQPGITDHRLVVIARKAMLYDQLQKSKPAVNKKVVKAPKLVRPGAPVSKKERDQSSIAKLKNQIKKSGGKEGIEAYLLRTGKV